MLPRGDDAFPIAVRSIVMRTYSDEIERGCFISDELKLRRYFGKGKLCKVFT